MRWIRDKINDRIGHIKDPNEFTREWQNVSDNWLYPEIRAVLFTQSQSAPLFFSALSVKFPGRIKFGIVHVGLDRKNSEISPHWKMLLGSDQNDCLPQYAVYSVEGKYVYGKKPGENYSFRNMELFLKFLYPCLNDIFIVSFCMANVMSWLEFFITNCGILRRSRKLFWCIFKYNVMVILLWLPVIGLFQMPLLDCLPLLFLKLQRLFTVSDFGSMIRGDFVFYFNNPFYVYISFVLYLIVVTYLCKKYREVDDVEESWFNYTQMQTLTHLRPNNLFEPVRISGGFDIFSSRFAQTSVWLQPSIPTTYIQNLPTWHYIPIPLPVRAAENCRAIEESMSTTDVLERNTADCTCDEDHETDPENSCTCQSVQSNRLTFCRCCCRCCKETKCRCPSNNFVAPPHYSSNTKSQNRLSDNSLCSSCQKTRKKLLERGKTVCKDCVVGTRPIMTNVEKSNYDLGNFACSCVQRLSKANTASSHHLHYNHCCHPASNPNRPTATPTSTTCKYSNQKSEKSNSQSMETCEECQNKSTTTTSTRSTTTTSTSSQEHRKQGRTTENNDGCERLSSSSSSSSSHQSTSSSSIHSDSCGSGTMTASATSSGKSLAGQSVSHGKGQGHGFPQGYLESHQCVICLDEYVTNTMLCGLPCGHVFHESCIISWLNLDKHFCPMCRWPSFTLPPTHSS